MLNPIDVTKIKIYVDTDIANLANDILTGKIIFMNNGSYVKRIVRSLKPLRDNGKLIVARDSRFNNTLLLLSDKPKKIEHKKSTFGSIFNVGF